jgi:ubiquinone/menaquinone biosynthesis C-methylase UbiE
VTWTRRLAASLVSRPSVYGLVQALAGQGRVAARLREALANLPAGRLLDVGSADGGFASRLGREAVFVDLDPRPLVALRRSGRGSFAAAADASRLPFPDRAFDVSVCVAVSHHLDDGQLESVVAELGRVTSGTLLFLDALRNEDRAVSKWLWRYDRGRHPRTRDQLREALERRFRLREKREFTIYHQYVLWVASPL